jgi:multicomponent Na+:H+ antiporter subunit B
MKIMLLLSILLVFRGHNYPGGGFIGALVASSAIALYTIAFSLKQAGFDRWAPKIIALGIICFALSFILPLLFNKVMITGLWTNFSLLFHSIKIGTPLLFDFGVYFCIVGSLIWIIAELEIGL